MVKTEPKFAVSLSGAESCGNLVSNGSLMHCDLGYEMIAFSLPYTGNAELCVKETPELLALRLSVLKGEANPGLLADLVEELQGNWIEGHYGADLILAKLRECW